MISFVIEFGSLNFDSLKRILSLILKEIGPVDTRIEILLKEFEKDLMYQEWDGSFEEALKKIQTGMFSSLLLKPHNQTEKFHILVFAPNFQDNNSNLWYGQVDWTTNYEKVNLTKFCRVKGIKFVSLSIEDTLDIEEIKDICYDSFPWEHWRLVEAYFTTSNKNKCLKEIRRGPAFKRIIEMEKKKNKK